MLPEKQLLEHFYFKNILPVAHADRYCVNASAFVISASQTVPTYKFALPDAPNSPFHLLLQNCRIKKTLGIWQNAFLPMHPVDLEFQLFTPLKTTMLLRNCR